MQSTAICVLGTGSMATCPRLVKNAAALAEAGFEVRVVTTNVFEDWSELDRELREDCRWHWNGVELTRRQREFRGLVRRGYRAVAALGGWRIPRVAANADHALTDAVARVAASERAALYIGHGAAALAAACNAGTAQGAAVAFDAEDFHRGELTVKEAHSLESRLRCSLESRFLPRCDFLTAGSPGIARAYESAYGVRMKPVLNVFPLADAPAAERVIDLENDSKLRAYWFSQTVGLDRGLQEFIVAMGLARTRVWLDIRGVVGEQIERALRDSAIKAGVEERITFLPPAPPREMISLAWDYDIGLSLETAHTLNRDICLTNKIFTYLLAGTPVLMSSTTAHRELAPELGDASKVTDLSDARAVAAAIDDWGLHRLKLVAARHAAWGQGRKRYNWDVEKRVFLDLVEKTLSKKRNCKFHRALANQV